jgi:molybdopterin molybdotransferase
MTDACATPGLLTLEQALHQIISTISSSQRYERLALKQALKRILFEDIDSAINVPSFRNSSMDGYAICSKDGNNSPLTIIGTSWAGKPFNGAVNTGECVRIFTGAVIPTECDCVVMQENVARTNETITLNKAPLQHENVRDIGDDTKKGQTLLHKGSSLKAADIGLLASCGIADVPVFRPVRVGFFSTGDELVAIGSHLEPGQIFDSNRYTLHALLDGAGAIPIDMGVIPDNPEAVENALLSASKHCDVIITSGGVSVGEADFITQVIEKIGTINLWKIAIKPGKPLVFGSVGKAAFFGLPGNPVSVMVTFKQVVLPALHKMMGHQTAQQPLKLHAIAAELIKKQPGRTEFQRGFVENNNGQLSVRATGGQGSHMLSSMSQANCLIVLEQSSDDIPIGQSVEIQLLEMDI